MRSQAPGKLLLFGEYAVLLGGNALATPVAQFGGRIAYDTPRGGLTKVQGRLPELSEYQPFTTLPWLHLESLKADLSKGMWIQSNIPSGYGLGSSGMVTALIYANYADQNHTTLAELKARLATIESFFHGSSSGIDPLTSLLNQLLHITDAGNQVTALDHLPNVNQHLYLLDSKRKRNTAQLVQAFRQNRLEIPGFTQASEHLVHNTTLALDAFLSADPHFNLHLRELSAAQLNLFDTQFIPADVRTLWQTGLDNQTYTMKLCGAGGGGFYQVWTEQPLGTRLSEFPLIQIY